MEAAVTYARCLAAAFVLACCLVGAVLGAIGMCVWTGVETVIGGRRG